MAELFTLTEESIKALIADHRRLKEQVRTLRGQSASGCDSIYQPPAEPLSMVIGKATADIAANSSGTFTIWATDTSTSLPSWAANALTLTAWDWFGTGIKSGDKAILMMNKQTGRLIFIKSVVGGGATAVKQWTPSAVGTFNDNPIAFDSATIQDAASFDFHTNTLRALKAGYYLSILTVNLNPTPDASIWRTMPPTPPTFAGISATNVPGVAGGQSVDSAFAQLVSTMNSYMAVVYDGDNLRPIVYGFDTLTIGLGPSGVTVGQGILFGGDDAVTATAHDLSHYNANDLISAKASLGRAITNRNGFAWMSAIYLGP